MLLLTWPCPQRQGTRRLNAPSERGALLLTPTQLCRGTRFTLALPMGKLRLGKELYPKPPTNKWECQLVSGTWGPGLRRAGPVPLAALHPARRREAPGLGSPQRQDPPRGLGTEALPNRGPSCGLHCRGSRQSQQMGRADQTGCHQRTRSGRTSLPGLGAQDRFKPSRPKRHHQPQPPVLRNSQGQFGDHRLPSLFRSWCSPPPSPFSLKNTEMKSTPPPPRRRSYLLNSVSIATKW